MKTAEVDYELEIFVALLHSNTPKYCASSTVDFASIWETIVCSSINSILVVFVLCFFHSTAFAVVISVPWVLVADWSNSMAVDNCRSVDFSQLLSSTFYCSL